VLNLELARRRRGWLCQTQEEVAAKVGVAKQTLSLWERGEAAPRIEHAIAWAKALGLEVNQLLIADPEVEPVEAAS
jgi:DNA-binding XRE family transcriptional regulator